MQELLDDVFIVDSNGKVMQPLESFYPMILNRDKINLSSIPELLSIDNYMKLHHPNRSIDIVVDDITISKNMIDISKYKDRVKQSILQQINLKIKSLYDITTRDEFRLELNSIRNMIDKYRTILGEDYECFSKLTFQLNTKSQSKQCPISIKAGLVNDDGDEVGGRVVINFNEDRYKFKNCKQKDDEKDFASNEETDNPDGSIWKQDALIDQDKNKFTRFKETFEPYLAILSPIYNEETIQTLKTDLKEEEKLLLVELEDANIEINLGDWTVLFHMMKTIHGGSSNRIDIIKNWVFVMKNKIIFETLLNAKDNDASMQIIDSLDDPTNMNDIVKQYNNIDVKTKLKNKQMLLSLKQKLLDGRNSLFLGITKNKKKKSFENTLKFLNDKFKDEPVTLDLILNHIQGDDNDRKFINLLHKDNITSEDIASYVRKKEIWVHYTQLIAKLQEDIETGTLTNLNEYKNQADEVESKVVSSDSDTISEPNLISQSIDPDDENKNILKNDLLDEIDLFREEELQHIEGYKSAVVVECDDMSNYKTTLLDKYKILKEKYPCNYHEVIESLDPENIQDVEYLKSMCVTGNVQGRRINIICNLKELDALRNEIIEICNGGIDLSQRLTNRINLLPNKKWSNTLTKILINYDTIISDDIKFVGGEDKSIDDILLKITQILYDYYIKFNSIKHKPKGVTVQDTFGMRNASKYDHLEWDQIPVNKIQQLTKQRLREKNMPMVESCPKGRVGFDISKTLKERKPHTSDSLLLLSSFLYGNHSVVRTGATTYCILPNIVDTIESLNQKHYRKRNREHLNSISDMMYESQDTLLKDIQKHLNQN